MSIDLLQPPKSLSLDAKTILWREKRAKTAPESSRGLLKRCWAGKASPREAIKAQCLECQGYDREAIITCTAPACPLYAYRPGQKRKCGKKQEKANKHWADKHNSLNPERPGVPNFEEGQ